MATNLKNTARVPLLGHSHGRSIPGSCDSGLWGRVGGGVSLRPHPSGFAADPGENRPALGLW